MKNKLIVSALVISSALAIGACGKDKKPATTDPTAAAPATTDTKADPAAGSAAKPDDGAAKPASGGW